MSSRNVHLKLKCFQGNYSTVLDPCGLLSISFEKSKYIVKIETSTGKKKYHTVELKKTIFQLKHY